MAKDDQCYLPVYVFCTANSEAGKSQGVHSLHYHSVLPCNSASVLLCLYLAGKKVFFPSFTEHCILSPVSRSGKISHLARVFLLHKQLGLALLRFGICESTSIIVKYTVLVDNLSLAKL